MIQIGTYLKVADNTGAKTVKCIKIVAKRQSKFAFVGDCILVSVRSVRSSFAQQSGAKRSIKKGQIFKALIIRTKKGISNRKYGHAISFFSNDVVLIDDNQKDVSLDTIGSRIFGPITRELRGKNFRKIISKARRVL